jgi:hypothetical protein
VHVRSPAAPALRWMDDFTLLAAGIGRQVSQGWSLCRAAGGVGRRELANAAVQLRTLCSCPARSCGCEPCRGFFET